MPTFTAMSGAGNAVVYMEAESADAVPSSITAAPDYEGMDDYANSLVTRFPEEATCAAIASRMGPHGYLAEGKQTHEETTVNLHEALAKGRDALRKAAADRVVEEDAEVELSADGDIAKADEDTRNVFGWAYVTHDLEGNVNVDKSGDFIDEVTEIEKSAYDFVLNSRQGDADHTNVKGATLVESMVFTPEKIEKMGLAAGSVPLGWWIGFHVEDDATWDRVKKGELRAFSIHGKGTRAKVEG